MAERRSSHRTQWAAQFAVASELCKQGYQVALTLGNHPDVDLMAESPKGVQFKIDVKGQYKPGFWIIRQRDPIANLFYVLVYVPDDKPNQFFALSQEQVNAEIVLHVDRVKQRQMKKGKPGDKADLVKGVPWDFAKKFENWDALPR